MSGAGLPRATSAVLKSAAGENQRSRSVRRSFHRRSSGRLLDATHLPIASRGSTVSRPAMALSSRSNSSSARRFIAAAKSSGSAPPTAAARAAYMSRLLTPVKRSGMLAAAMTWPKAAKVSTTARQAITSLSTSTPSQSKMTRSMQWCAALLFLGIDVDGHAGIVFGCADGERRAHMRDIGRRGQLGGEEPLVAVPVDGDDLEQEVGLAGEHVRLAHLGPGERQGFERLQVRLGLARQPDLGEDGDAEAQQFRIDVGMISADEAGLLERAHAPQARRRRDARALGEIDIGHAATGLQVTQDASIDLVELDAAHRRISEENRRRAAWYYTVIILQVTLAAATRLQARGAAVNTGRRFDWGERWQAQAPPCGWCMTARSAWPTKGSASP